LPWWTLLAGTKLACFSNEQHVLRHEQGFVLLWTIWLFTMSNKACTKKSHVLYLTTYEHCMYMCIAYCEHPAVRHILRFVMPAVSSILLKRPGPSNIIPRLIASHTNKQETKNTTSCAYVRATGDRGIPTAATTTTSSRCYWEITHI
jgi:ABC-type uncharacterized transport system substrate-binding protein